MRVKIDEWEEDNIVYYDLTEEQVKLLKELEKISSIANCINIDYLDEQEYKEVN